MTWQASNPSFQVSIKVSFKTKGMYAICTFKIAFCFLPIFPHTQKITRRLTSSLLLITLIHLFRWINILEFIPL